ncbi:MAG: LysR substrate-binding domain-containing protein [Pseudonocardiales bacterium]
MDAHTRRLRYFVAVAEDLHFSRAAARLFVAQQALSKQIHELESDLGTQLLHRNTRKVELTPAGEAFLVAAREALAAFDEGVDAARRAAQESYDVLKVGFVVGAALALTTPILAEFTKRHPQVRLDLHEFPLRDSAAGLAEGSTDVAFIRLPISVPHLEFEPVFVEPRVAVVPAGHRLAARQSVGVAELLDEALTIGHSPDVAWRDFWSLAAYRHGAAPPRLIGTNSPTEEMHLVAAGIAITVTAAALSRITEDSTGVSFVPIDDIPGSALVAAWRPGGGAAALVEQFLAVTRDVRDREVETVHAIEHPVLSPAASR